MNLLDILIAKKKSFTGETESLVRRANAAMAQANTVAEKLEQAGEVLEAANSALSSAEAANEYAQEVISDLDNMKTDVASAAAATVNSIIEENTITSAVIENANTSTAKIKQVKFTKNGTTQTYDVEKNYTATGLNEDGGMTQRAITNALAAQKSELENRINNIPTSGGSGNISGNLDPEDEGKLVTIDENGHLIASSILEDDIIKLQLDASGLVDDSIVGLEIDYLNKTFTRLQGAEKLMAGNSFNKYSMYGGRKRCIVDESGNIIKFLTPEDTIESVENERIMVYQPPVYYCRKILSTSNISQGIKITKEQIFISEKARKGYTLHPIFKDENNNDVKFVLLPAYESGTLRANGEIEKNDAQNIDFENDKLISTVNVKPISGVNQDFTITAAKQLAENNGSGWYLTDLRFESLQQILMIIEFGALNMQNAFNKGITNLSSNYNGNKGCTTGSTHSLLNTTGQASETTSRMDSTYTYNTEGNCSISYRGVENPYGNMWRFIDKLNCNYHSITYNNVAFNFSLPNESNWINCFGYDPFFDWAFLPIEASNGANSSLPVGDYIYSGSPAKATVGLAGGFNTSAENAGLFYYAFDNDYNGHYRSVSGRVMFIPTANSLTETTNYNLWKIHKRW